jgi:signal transduction histidine kinase/tetratricopeptide (TPR) repeat protein
MMSRTRWWVVCCALMVCLPGMAQSQQQALAALDAMATLSYQDSAGALKQLQAQAPAFENSPFPEVERRYLVTLIGAYVDAGQGHRTQAAIDRLMAISQSRHDVAGQVMATAAKAHRLASTGKAGDGLVLLDSVKPAALRTTDPEAKWIFHLTTGSLHNTIGQFEPALANILASLDFARARPLQSQASTLRSEVQLGLVYMAMKNSEQALETIDKADALATSLGAVAMQGALQLNRGHVVSDMGHPEAAEQAYQAALKIANAAGQVGLQAAALNNLGDIYLIRKDYAKAEPFERLAMARYEAAGEPGGAALSRANVGFALMGQGRIKEGVTEVQAGLTFMRDAGARAMEEILLAELSRMYEQAGLFREAIETTRNQQVLSKALFNADREQAVATLRAQFDATQRERQIEELAQNNRLKDAEIHQRRLLQVATLAGAALLLAAGGFIGWLYRRARQSNRELLVAQELARQALNDKNLFLATASHDLRQPVHAMSMMVEAIGLRNQDADVAPLLVDLKSSMVAMNQLFNALLDLSRLEAGGQRPASVPVSLPALLGEVARNFRGQASVGGIELRLHLPRRGATVQADPTLLRQAVVNLTHNAIRYTQRGRVLIGVRRRGGQWAIEVWDTGIGIAPEEERHVFNAYFRSANALRLDSAGHGLGLAVVARSADLMGAAFGFQSRLGRGSRFWLQLAASPTPGDEAALAPGHAAQRAPGVLQRLAGRCLVLDDDLQVLTAWKAMLAGWGIEARFASTAAEAFAHIEGGFEPSAILCDQRLRSGESGFDILRALLVRCPAAGGAMVSGELQSADLAQAEDEGYLVLRKPLDLVALHAVLANWLQPVDQTATTRTHAATQRSP